MPTRIPAGATTSIGSLPHADPEQAVAFVTELARAGRIDIPAWPQLPKRDLRELMVPQFAMALPGFTVDEAKRRFFVDRAQATPEALAGFYEKALDPEREFPLAPEYAAGYFAFAARAAALDPAPAFVKGQLTGPLTFVLGLNLDDGRPVWADPELRQAALMLLAKGAAWQAKALRPLAREGVVIFMDEPIYDALGTAAYLSVTARDVCATVNEVARAAREAGAVVGLHCCGNADWEAVLSSEIDILSFDAWGYLDALALFPGAVSSFLERGGRLAWGVVPTNEDIAAADERAVAQKLDQGLARLVAKGVDESRLRAQALVTPSCGCGSRTVVETEKVFHLLGAAGAHWKSSSGMAAESRD
jgi:hypothetical protein